MSSEVSLANILIVEDDCDTAEGLAELLFAIGHDTRTAPNGLEGLRRIAERVPDVVLLDAEMPILDGPGMARRLADQRAGLPRIPIVLISAAANIRDLARQMSTPHFLKKPFSLNVLIHAIEQALTGAGG
jgi:CheY-like chemotaxis protein